jgi:hypothetical protein
MAMALMLTRKSGNPKGGVRGVRHPAGEAVAPRRRTAKP